MCLSPLHARIIGRTASGKKVLEFIKYDDYLMLTRKGIDSDILSIKCGHCDECLLEHSKEWADRLMTEAMNYPPEQRWFITLTYNNDFVPRSEWFDEITGECGESLTLRKKHAQKFIKRLRINYERKCKAQGVQPNHLKYYLSGEYGSGDGVRPHYHLIVFGLPLDDLKPISQSASGFNQWYSEFIDDCWSKHIKKIKYPFGLTSVCEVSWDCCAYVARYTLKKHYGAGRYFYDRYQLEPEFSLMSRKPAIGREFYERNKERMYELDNYHISTPQGGRLLRPCRYYDKLFDIDNPERMEEIKMMRQEKMEGREASLLEQTSMTRHELNEARGYNLKSTVNASLKRRLKDEA